MHRNASLAGAFAAVLLLSMSPPAQAANEGLIIHSTAGSGVSEYSFLRFIQEADRVSYRRKRGTPLTQQQRNAIVQFAQGEVGRSYCLGCNAYKGQGGGPSVCYGMTAFFGYTCTGLAEKAYEVVLGGNGITPPPECPEFTLLPNEQIANMDEITAAQVLPGDLIFRDSRTFDVIPGEWDHVGIVANLPGPDTLGLELPPLADRDGDHVPDVYDACPDAFGVSGGFSPGCPDVPGTGTGARMITQAILLSVGLLTLLRRRTARPPSTPNATT